MGIGTGMGEGLHAAVSMVLAGYSPYEDHIAPSIEFCIYRVGLNTYVLNLTEMTKF